MAAAQWTRIWRICKDKYLAANPNFWNFSSTYYESEVRPNCQKRSTRIIQLGEISKGSKKLSSVWISKTNTQNPFCEIEREVHLHLLLRCNHHHHYHTAVRMDGTRWSLISQFNATWSIDSSEAKIEFTFNEILYLALGLENLLNRLQNCEILFPRLEEDGEHQQVQQDVVVVIFSFIFPVKGISWYKWQLASIWVCES